MIALPVSPVRRVALFIFLSALLHALLLWLPEIRLPHAKVDLPPLTVRLQHVPQLPQSVSAIPEGWSLPGQGSMQAAASAVPTIHAMQQMKASTVDQLFPKHLQLSFAVQRAASVFAVDRLTQHLEIEQDRYVLTSLWDKQRLSQSSQGALGQHGLRPDLFGADSLNANDDLSRQARFDWINRKLHLFDNRVVALDDNAQDVLSFMYQIGRLPLDTEYFSLPICDGEQLAVVQIEIGPMEEIDTGMGTITARHLRQMHERQQAYFEIWIAPEYRLLPVKFRRMDADEQAVEEYTLRDIRAAD